MSVIVVIPTYNEADNLVPLCKALLSLALELEILIVDDASPDGTGELAQELADTEYKIRVIHRAEKLGLGTAYTQWSQLGTRKHQRNLNCSDGRRFFARSDCVTVFS